MILVLNCNSIAVQITLTLSLQKKYKERTKKRYKKGDLHPLSRLGYSHVYKEKKSQCNTEKGINIFGPNRTSSELQRWINVKPRGTMERVIPSED